MPKVQLPNGTELNFPDGMSQEDMASAIDANFPEYAAKKEGGLMGMLHSAGSAISDAIKSVPIIAPNGQGGGVMETTAAPAPASDMPPVAGMAPSKWAEIQKAERTDPLDPRMLAIKPRDIIARGENEAALRHHANAPMFSRLVENAGVDNAREASESEQKAYVYSPQHFADVFNANARNVGAGLLKIGPTAAKGLLDIGRMASGDAVGKDYSNYLEDAMKRIDQLVASPQFNDNSQGFQQLMADKNVGVGDLFSYLVDHPDVLLDNGITTVGSMALPAGTAKVAAIGSKAAGLGTVAAGAVGTATTIGTVAAQNAADTFTSDNLKDASMGDRYRAASVSAAISILTGMATHGGAEGEIARRMAGDVQAGRTTMETVKAFLKAVGNEGAQEMGEEFGGAAGEAVGSLTPMNANNTAKRMAFAGLVGGVFGGMTHASSAGDQRHVDDGSAGAEAARQAALRAWRTNGLSPNAGGPAAPAAPAGRTEPSWSDVAAPVDPREPTFGPAGAPVPQARTEPTIGDVMAATSVDEALAAAQAIARKPIVSPYATAHDIDALEREAGMRDAALTPELANNRNFASSGGIDLTAGQVDPDAPPASNVWRRAADQAPTPQRDAIDRIIDPAADWHAFPADTGTLGVPRADMPQIKAEHRGAMTQFLNARGITHEQVEVPAESLKPTQAEFSLEKVLKASEFTGGNRSILVSSDGYVLDGHHQWLNSIDNNELVKAIRLNAPIAELLQTVKEFPSATVAEGAPDSGVIAATNASMGSVDTAPAAEQSHLDAARQAAENIAQRKSTGGSRARDRVHTDNPFLGFLATHGVNIADRSDSGAERGRAGNPLVPGFGPVFRKSGLRFDELASAAHEAGFLTKADIESELDTGGTRKLADMIERATQGKEVIRPAVEAEHGQPGAHDALMQEAHDLGIDARDMTPDQVYDAVIAAHDLREQHRQETGAATVDEQAKIERHADQFTAKEASAVLDADIPLSGLKTDAHLTDEQIDEIFGITPGARAGGQEAESHPAGTAGESGAGTEKPGDLLAGYTREEVVQKQDAEEAHAKAIEAERRRVDATRKKDQDAKDTHARIAGTVDDFKLGQSSEEAVVGQKDIFSASSDQDQTDNIIPRKPNARDGIEAVNTRWRELFAEHSQWFTGDGTARKLRQDAPENVREQYADYLKAKKAAKAEYDGKPAADHSPSAKDIQKETSNVQSDADTGADVPLAFFKKIKVPHEVWIADEGVYETVELPAHKALASVREDIGNLERLLECLKG